MLGVLWAVALAFLAGELLGLRPFALVGLALVWCSQRTPLILTAFWVRFGGFVTSAVYTLAFRRRHPNGNPHQKWLDFYQIHCAAHFEVNGSCQVTTLARLEPSVSAAAVRDAALRLQRHHPLLRAALCRENGASLNTPCCDMVFMDCLRGKDVEVLEHDCDIDEAVEREQLVPLAPEVLGWRLALCGEHLLLTYHHCFLDGVSVMTILENLLALLDGQDLKECPPEEKMAPPPRDDLPWYAPWVILPSGGDLASLHWQRTPAWLKPMAKGVPWHARRLKQVRRTLRADVTERLREQCRKEQTTVTGALAAAACHSMAEVLGFSEPLRCKVQVNIRPDCQRPRCTLGNYLGHFRCTIAPEKSFWEIARDHRAELQRHRQEGQHLLLAVVQPYPYHLQLACGEKTHPHPDDHPGIGNDLGISNRGAFSLATKSHSITAVHWVRQHRGDSDSDYLLLNACSVNGVLCLTLCYKHPIVDEAVVVAIADGLVDRLAAAAGAECAVVP